MVLAVLLSVVVSGAGGVYLGLRNRATLEEIRAEFAAQQAAEAGGGLSDMSTEVNRAMMELWKMEDVEYMRNSR